MTLPSEKGHRSFSAASISSYPRRLSLSRVASRQLPRNRRGPGWGMLLDTLRPSGLEGRGGRVERSGFQEQEGWKGSRDRGRAPPGRSGGVGPAGQGRVEPPLNEAWPARWGLPPPFLFPFIGLFAGRFLGWFGLVGAGLL